MTTVNKDELDVVLPEQKTLTVYWEGKPIQVRVRRFKTLEILALLRVLTSGLGPDVLRHVDLDTETPEAMGGSLLGLLLVAVPQSAHDFVHFVQVICEPVNTEDEHALHEALNNPEADAMLEVFEVMAYQEADDLRELMGKVRSMWSRVSTLYTKKGKQKRSTPARSQ